MVAVRLSTPITLARRWRSRGTRREGVVRACHELRGSITAARLGLELAVQPAGAPAARLRAIGLELEKASLALDDLQRLATRAGRPRLAVADRVDLRALLADSVEAWRAAAARAGVELSLRWSGPPAEVVGDRLRLAQATGNLIANAVEHGEGDVEIRARPDAQGVRVEVTDRGPGLRAPVEQLTGRARRGRGTRGRGLAIAVAIAEAHGGRLGVAPSDGGARLVLALPARPRPRQVSRRRA